MSVSLLEVFSMHFLGEIITSHPFFVSSSLCHLWGQVPCFVLPSGGTPGLVRY